MNTELFKKVTPGIHPNLIWNQFEGEEQDIIRKIGNEFFVTTGGRITLLTSEYRYFLMKPTPVYSEMFNIDRELLCIFSPYENFEPRTLDAFSIAQSQLADLRVETVCRILVSKDSAISTKIDSLLKVDPEQPIVIPFTYNELQSAYDSFFIRNRFRNNFYSRDLFSFLSPLKKDLYFFGRSELIQQLTNRHRSGEHTGLFGLRKSGKTSIVYAIERHLVQIKENVISIDCESPSIHKLRWNELLLKVVQLYKIGKQSKAKIDDNPDRYTEKLAADNFEKDIFKIYNSKKKTNTLIIFDEIERISPCTGSSEHWAEGEDFIYFWQTLRGFYQRNHGVYTYLLVGTNPNCVEYPIIGKHENPLFASIPSQYVPSFTVEQVRQMVRRLGRYMGMQFDELIYSKLADDYGGHPFLIRQICSKLHNHCKGDRPVTIDKKIYEDVRALSKIDTDQYLEMILQVLMDWYPDEYEMISFLALGDVVSFNEFAGSHSSYTKHLIGYGLLQQSKDGFTFNIEAIKEYLNAKKKYQRINLTLGEKIEEISNRRNKIEKGLRTIIKNALKLSYGKKKSEEKALAAIPSSRRDAIGDTNIDSLLHKDNSPLYFIDLKNIINREWSIFENTFDVEKKKVEIVLEEINKFGRPDAHSKSITQDEFDQLRLHFNFLENIIEEWVN